MSFSTVPQKQPPPQDQPGQQAHNDGTAADLIYNIPNAVSMARLVSGPVIAYWMLHGQVELATAALLVSGASDWLDGFLARRLRQSSVFGSFLDPLADKALVGCVAGVLLYNGTMPAWLGAVVVGRDVILVSGSFLARWAAFGWRWPGSAAFFRTTDSRGPAAHGTRSSSDGGGSSSVGYMRPLLISKANTVLQLLLVGGYLLQQLHLPPPLAGWPPAELLRGLELATAATTVTSLAMYVRMYQTGKLGL